MRFEYDARKSASNKTKHGIDFEEAQALWNDSRRVLIDLLSDDEPRFIVIGRVGGKTWTAICTMRGEAVRIISVRRSRKNEMAYYEEDFGN